MAELTPEAVAAVLAAAGEISAARKQSGWKLTQHRSAVLVNYQAAGAGEAVMKREALARWMPVLGAQGWTVEGRGSRRLAWLYVTAPDGGAR